MNLNFDLSQVPAYHSGTQIARVITEKWIEDNMFCPRCGSLHIEHFPNNKPVADFYCPNCLSEYELKSKSGTLQHRVVDGAYSTMIQRITSNQNPDFLFMSYSRDKMCVTDLLLVPKHFFIPEIIEKRKPLGKNARRAGWIGCNIILDGIPEQGRVEIISAGVVRDKNAVISMVGKGNSLATEDINARGWLMDVLSCINQLPEDMFTLAQIYEFANKLYRKHPQNHNVKPKIRQQLQLLRDKGYIEFLGGGHYKKI